jgi:hypothetical protein
MFNLPLPSRIDLVNVSPLDDLGKLTFFILPILYLSFNSLQFFRKVSTGATIIYRRGQILSLRIESGRVELTKSQKAKKYVASFNGPLVSALLGLLFFAAAQFLTVILFLRAEYTW